VYDIVDTKFKCVLSFHLYFIRLVNESAALKKTRLLRIFLWTISLVEHYDMEMSYDLRVCMCVCS
jgi:hypothetical protein